MNERRKTPWHDWASLVGIIGIVVSIWYNTISTASDRGRLEQKVVDLSEQVEVLEKKVDDQARDILSIEEHVLAVPIVKPGR